MVVPTRELAIQTFSVVRQSGTQIKAMALYGGRPTMDEHRSMSSIHPQLVVGTPGRLLDHMQKCNIDPSTITTLIIDEFDKSLELGFRDEMTAIFSMLPNVKKRVLLSATDDPEISSFLSSYSRLDYLNASSVSSRIEQWVVESLEKDKLTCLKELLCSIGNEPTLVFVGYRESVVRVTNYLREQHFVVTSIHGGMEQKDRERGLFRYVGGSANILVSTDLASRGLDIPELYNVVHYHLPINQETFLHRNGRTARWDRTGRSFILLGPEEHLPEYVAECKKWIIPTFLESPSMPKWDSLYIGRGKKEKLSRGDIAGFLMKIGELRKEEVGRIDVRDHYSYVSVDRNSVDVLLSKVRGHKIKGMKTIIEKTR